MKKLICALGALLVTAAFAVADEARTMAAKSPDGLNSIEVVRKDGVLSISAARRGVVALTARFEGLSFASSDEGPNPARDAVVGVTTSQTAGTRQTPVYKRASISLAGNRTRIDFAHGWSVELAARNDGVAYRFVTSGKGRRQIRAEQTTFAYPSAACEVWPGYCRKAWKGDQFQWGCQPANAKELVSSVQTNLLMCLPMLSHDPKSGVWALLAEADLRDYPGMSLWRAPGTAAGFTAAFAACPDKTENTKRFIRVTSRKNYIADVAAARTFPWRVILMGDEAKHLSDSDAVAALSQGPDKGADFSWVKPGLVAWDWWNDWNLKGVPFKPGIDTRTYKYYIDFASRHGIPYVILDEGWSVKLDVTRVQENIDLPELIRYGAERNVDIILWCAWAQLPGRQDEIFSKYAKMGVKGFKIDFFNRDDQVVMAFLEETARIAAKYRFHVDYHGICKPGGLEQRYPNILSYEGVHGLEELKWVKHRDMPRIDCQHFFLRNSAGPMDYTPGAMRNKTRADWKPNYHAPASQGTRCHQLALLTLFFSPLQMMADTPTNYEANEECARYMAETPTTWDETVTLDGIPGEFAAVARRKGEVWWVAAISDWQARELELDLGFLASSGEWVAETFADAPDSDLNPEHYVRTPAAPVGRTLKVKMTPGGGFVARIRRPVRIAVYEDVGARSCGAFRHLEIATSVEGAKAFPVDAQMIRDGALDGADVLIMPGGSATAILRHIGADARQRIVRFIRGGGGYIGTCAGCYVVTGPIEKHEDRLGLIPFTSGGYSGHAEMPIELTLEAQTLCGVKAGVHEIDFSGGPVLDAGKPVVDSDIRVIAYYRPNFGPKSFAARMADRPAIAAGRCGKGRIFASAVHPEKDCDDHYVLKAAYSYVTGRTLTWTLPKNKPAARRVGLICGDSLGVATSRILQRFVTDWRIDLVPVNAQDIKAGALEKLETVIAPGGAEFSATGGGLGKNAPQAKAFLARGGKILTWGLPAKAYAALGDGVTVFGSATEAFDALVAR